MKKISKKIISVKKVWLLLLISLIIVTTFSLSKFRSTTANESVTKIALMADDVAFSIENTEKGYPGYRKIYPIEITNKSDGKVCEVSQKYTITLKEQAEKNIPLDIALYKDKNCTIPLEDDNNDGTYESDDFSFNAGQANTKKYYLKMNWPEDKNNSYYSLEVNYVRIDFIINQLD